MDGLLDAWGPALGDRLPLRRASAEQFLSLGVDAEASAVVDGGLVVAKRQGRQGWIGALLVAPDRRGRGTGRALLGHAVDALSRAGVEEIVLGADRLHLLPGIPEPGPDGFFRQAGFDVDTKLEFDLACSLADWRPSGRLPEAAPAESWDEVTSFIADAFPGRWHWEAEEARRRGGSPAYYLLLRVDGAAAGFARIHHEQPGAPPPGLVAPSAHWWPAGPGFGGIGPIGVGAPWRGRGLGLGLLEAAMAHLRDLGAAQVAVDWTTLTDFYARTGLTPCRSYRRGRLRVS